MIWKTQGFNLIKDFFEKAMINGQSFDYTQDKLSHAYIFSGQEMIGKRTFALELPQLINNYENSNHTTHYDISIYHTPDVLAVDPSMSDSGEAIPIEKIRDAKNFLSLSAYTGPYKFVIINDAEKMTVESQNAFLKILEEPSASSIIILVSAYPDELLPTILSRCQEIKFPNHSVKAIKAVLLEENATEEKAEFLSEFVNGRLGLALRIVRGDEYKKVKDYLEELANIKKAILNDKFKLAQELNKEEGNRILREKILFWMLYLRMHQTAPDSSKILKQFIQLNYAIGQPQFNRRLMLENFMVKL